MNAVKRESDDIEKLSYSQMKISNMLKNIDTRELIDAIQRRKCLWDRMDPEYRDRTAKDKAWKEIYKEIEPSYESMKPTLRNEFGICITKKWYNIRDSYVKSKKQTRTSRPYLYSNSLTFLDPILLGDDNSHYIEDKISNDDVESSENWINEVFVDVDENIGESAPKRAKLDYSKVKEEIDDTEANMVNIFANLIQKEEDEDRAFFKSITPAVKMLSEDAKLEFKIQVMKLIKVLRVKDKKGLKKDKMYRDSDSD